MVNVTANIVTATLSIPFVFALGVWRHWWKAPHSPLTYVALAAVALSIVSVTAVFLRHGASSDDFRKMLLTSGVLYASLIAGWAAANTSGILQVILSFVTFAFAPAMMIGLLLGITAAISGDEIDDFDLENSSPGLYM